MRRTAALIVGGGPAGAAAAIALARAGLPHLLLERTRETADALCGGFLSWRTLDRLARLGVEAAMLHPHPVRRVRIVAGESMRVTALPQPGLAVSRRRLDTLLLARAAAAGAAIERGVAVRSAGGGVATLADGGCIAADRLFLATGKHELRGLARAAPRAADPTLGLRLHLPAAPSLHRLVGDAVELHLFDRGYAGIAVQEDGRVNCCLAVRRSRLHEAGDAARLLLRLGAENPHLGERLAHGGAAAGIDAVANVPYGWRAAAGVAGLFRLGDQAAVIASLAGEGIGIALASGGAAADAHRRGDDGAGWQRGFARDTAWPVGAAGALRRISESAAGRRLAPLLPAAAIRLLAQATRLPARLATPPASG